MSDLSQLQIVVECARVGLAVQRAYQATQGILLPEQPTQRDIAKAQAKAVIITERLGERALSAKDVHEIYSLDLNRAGKPMPAAWADLPEQQRVSDTLFFATVAALYQPH